VYATADDAACPDAESGLFLDFADGGVGRASPGSILPAMKVHGGVPSLRLAISTPAWLVTMAATTGSGSGMVDGSVTVSSSSSMGALSRARTIW
jgi:hypothetical protein